MPQRWSYRESALVPGDKPERFFFSLARDAPFTDGHLMLQYP